ncbi:MULTISPECIES: helix-turn-helix domain-containing protein [unclassified Streptomyces]|uniref:Helix-turn-helix domain-containing protein n=1 Tax=Streptomyces sp. R35 TaxID=3238630 RepID=A0AB39SD56_9ACTN|nr:helix-turn-helix domain-containing protein [Streptomyces sp. NBC_01236]
MSAEGVQVEHTEADAPTGLGDRIRALRARHGLKQQDLASQDVSISYISLIESGKRTPSESVLSTIANKLGSSVEYLRTGRDAHELGETHIKVAFGEMALRNGANGEALQTFSEVLAHRAALDTSMIRRALVGQATALEKLGRLEAAIPILEDLFREPSLAAGSDDWCRIAVALCRCYRNSGDITVSIEIGERALAELDSLGLDVTMDHIQLGSSLMASYYMRGDLTRAHLLGERLIPASEAEGSYAARGAVYWNAGLVANSRGKLPEALALVERALAMMAEGDNQRHVAQLKMNFGYLLLQSDLPDPDRAKELLEAAQQSLAEVGNADDLARCEISLADAEKALGHWDEAVAHAERALGLLGTEPRVLSTSARATLAEIYFLKQEPDRALKYLKAAARQLRHFPPSHEATLNWRYIGDLWQRHGNDIHEALKAYDMALSSAGVARTAHLQATLADDRR